MPKTGQHAEYEGLQSANLSGISVSQPLSQGSGVTVEEEMESLQEPEAMDGYYEAMLSRHHRATAHMNPYDWGNMDNTKLKPDKIQ